MWISRILAISTTLWYGRQIRLAIVLWTDRNKIAYILEVWYIDFDVLFIHNSIRFGIILNHMTIFFRFSMCGWMGTRYTLQHVTRCSSWWRWYKLILIKYLWWWNRKQEGNRIWKFQLLYWSRWRRRGNLHVASKYNLRLDFD